MELHHLHLDTQATENRIFRLIGWLAAIFLIFLLTMLVANYQSHDKDPAEEPPTETEASAAFLFTGRVVL